MNNWETGKPIPTVLIFDVEVSKLNMEQTLDHLTTIIENEQQDTRSSHQIITANPIMIMTALESPSYKKTMQRAELVVPDGTGLVWATQYIGHPVSERVAGFDLMQLLLARGEKRGWKVYLLGASPEIIQTTKDKLIERYPNLQLVGYRDGYFTEAQDAEVIEEIRRLQPDLLFVGRSVYTQDPWIDQYREQLGVPIMMGVGGSFDVISGKLKRAPVLFQKLRLEWLFRLLQQPSRAGRMLALPKFMLKVMLHKKKLKQAQNQ